MNSFQQDFSTLADNAIPVEGSFAPYVGTVQFFESYQCKVMLQDAVFEYKNIKNKNSITSYTFKKGYIMLKPLID